MSLCARAVTLRPARSLSYLRSREAIIIDLDTSIDSWNMKLSAQALKHPSSPHIISKYSSYIHETMVYNFNSVGEFNLSVTPSFKFCSEANDCYHNDKSHGVIVIPDLIHLKNVKQADIPFIYDILKSSSQLTLPAFEHDFQAPENVFVQSIEQTTVCISLSAFSTVDKCKKIIAWIDAAAQQKHPGKEINYLLVASDFGKHPLATNVLVLPQNYCYENVFLEKQVTKIVDSFQE